MSIYEIKQKLSEKYENGIWLDYQNDTWLFFMKDDIWQKEEIERIHRADITIGFMQKGIVDAFLLEIFDCLETSDLPFCMKDVDEKSAQKMFQCDQYRYEIIAIDKDNVVVSVRDGQFTKKNSTTLKQALQSRLNESFTSDDFAKAYDVLSTKYEPFELEQFNVFQQGSKDTK